MSQPIPTVVLGGTGYVAGELLRLLVQHPRLEIAAVMSESQAGNAIRNVFPQLQGSLGEAAFMDRTAVLDSIGPGPTALFSAAPHGASAGLIAGMLQRAETASSDLTVVDVSADFRYRDAAEYESVYGQPHGAPQLLPSFRSSVPEHLSDSQSPHIGHPGCFATALLMAIVPLIQLELTQGDLHAVGVTGSTGAGRSPSATTHHPERHANMFAYKPLAHRHAPEVEAICEALTGHRPAVRFVPHSGPFSRGIHMTLQARLKKRSAASTLRTALEHFYADSQFVIVRQDTPRIKNVVGSNFCHIGVAADGDSVAVFVVIDNLVKGAAGGAIQWMNRKLGLAEHDGLTAPAIGWS
ncbi:MAG: N-acetyl-gamma-glutamyl-phosphate reductase [Gammaproteobacteria bacterium]|nr:N-acetyl-gamma-glutamyl-phosphate reductase [Gammaproteobacteria bacterium]